MKRVHENGRASVGSSQWFREARYGMFIHFGLYSLLARHEWAMFYERIPAQEYRKLALRFNPKSLRIGDWVALAKEVGMRYMCLTTRHHEGYCLFDTRTTDFNSVQTAAKRDFVREYVEACRKARMRVGLYYSFVDWSDPRCTAGPKKDPAGWRGFVAKVHAQLRELMTNYGKIDYLFYDGCPPRPESWDCAGINAQIRRWQPGILISSRCGLEEDVMSTEGFTIADPGKRWEACMTSDNSWGYNAGDGNWKTPHQVAKYLMECAHNGGNFLFNVGPRGDGRIPAPVVQILRRVGDWLDRNGEAVYGVDPHPFSYFDQKFSTASGKTAYVGLHYYPGPQTVIAGVGNRVKSVRILATDKKIPFRQEGDRVFLTGLPKKAPDPVFPVVAMELDGKPRGVRNPLLWAPEPVGKKAAVDKD